MARVLLISDDREMGERYHDALASGGYAVTQAASFIDTLATSGLDPDVILLCHLTVFSYPAQTALIVRVPADLTPAQLVSEVHRRVALPPPFTRPWRRRPNGQPPLAAPLDP